ncbi:MAG: hypothetical protein IIB26_10200, partial [Chloroflexi bacterium]|nr:hypothetical protein [Chloroflexota bacterium]
MGVQTLTRRARRPLLAGLVTMAIAVLATTFGGDWVVRADGSSGSAPGTLPGTLPDTLPPVSDPAAPDSPELAFAIAGDGEAGIVWAAPRTGDPGDVDSYTVTSVPDSGEITVDAPQRHVIVDGLANGVEYVFSVVAIGPGGASDPTATNAVTPGEDESVITGQLEKLERHIQDKLNKTHARFQDARGKALARYEKHEGRALANFEKHVGKAEARFERFQGQALAKLERARGTRRFERAHVQVTERLQDAEERLDAEITRIGQRLNDRLDDLSEHLRVQLQG